MQEDKKIVLDIAKVSKDLKNIISDVVGVKVSAIKDSTDLQEDLGIDSFNATEILVVVEQKYGLTINKSQVFNVSTFKDVLNLVQKHIHQIK